VYYYRIKELCIKLVIDTSLYMLRPERIYFEGRNSWIKKLFICFLGSELVQKTYIYKFNVVYKVQFLTLC